jgi:hypothetical protein
VHGILTGIPAGAGLYNVKLTATGGAGTASTTLSLAVQPPAPPSQPVITSGTSATGKTLSAFNFQVRARGVTSAARFSATWLPPGLTLNSITGRLSGTPTTSGSYEVALAVTEGSARVNGSLQLTLTSDSSLPLINSPSEVTLVPGQAFTYSIGAPGDGTGGPTTYGFDGVLPPGLTFDRKTGVISGVYNPLRTSPASQIGHVQLFAYNFRGTATLPLTFLAPRPTAAANIATRAVVGTGDNVLIGGFIITGSGPKRVIVRAIGPSSGLIGALQDPTLELRDSSGKFLQANDDWQSTQEQEIKDTTIPPGDPRESAIVTTLLPGAYTTIVGSKGGAAGPALVEVYDLDGAGDSRLAQISTRGNVQQSDNVLIGGFIVTGDSAANVLVRGIGPELALANVPNPLQDPTLELHDGNGSLIASNDDWESDQKQAIIDTTIPPKDAREPAILETLPAGNYTAIVRGKDNSVGVALVEIYVLE